MKKSDLKNGAIVETRGGNRYIKIDDTLINLCMMGTFVCLTEYSEDLCNPDSSFDIVKVNNNVLRHHKVCSNALWEVQNQNKWTWDRNNPILTDKEKQYLKNLITPFKERIIGIEKLETVTEQEFLSLSLNDTTESFDLPYFPKGEYYKGMDQETMYSLQDLDLL